MLKIETVEHLPLDEIDTVAFAGGGNRCWWQGGLISYLMDQGWQLPGTLIGTSAGAAVAASCLTDGPKAALDACLRLYAANQRIVDWGQLRSLKMQFAHQEIYPEWLRSFVHVGNFEQIRQSPSRLHVAITRPARLLGVSGSVVAGTLAYVADKYLWHSIHPRLPKLLGLRQEFHAIHEAAGHEDAQSLLSAAAAAPPFMSSRRIHGAYAIDGGYIDNAPIPQQSDADKSRTLVLLTRFYPKLPTMFRREGRWYWQPSMRVPVSTWDCTARATVKEAFSLGNGDAVDALNRGKIRL
ncbi:patatin-like phospholipase family protein [Herbaspirillum rhizosphaerae]|uniref:patatin-like phospholipase family protein n=1 Tax=Herbaspirillum rhizosphaerae TaxID=346179 RepID=UPI00067B0C78|nr:patatin-like phospholipase family protein [Herbaspirillum rhizosphaerae]